MLMYKKSLNIRLKLFGENHDSIASLHRNISYFHVIQGKLDDAMLKIKKSLKIRLAFFGKK